MTQSWGNIYCRYKRRGMDHADAAYRADEWERNQRRAKVGDELVRIEMPDGFLTIPASFGGQRLKLLLDETRAFAEFVYNCHSERGDGMCEAALTMLRKLPRQHPNRRDPFSAGASSTARSLTKEKTMADDKIPRNKPESHNKYKDGAPFSGVILTWLCSHCGWANDNNSGPCRKCGRDD